MKQILDSVTNLCPPMSKNISNICFRLCRISYADFLDEVFVSGHKGDGIASGLFYSIIVRL